ncbi:MAG: LuxR C-terminal-related transcriptional regulator [Alphaproteobacteria bacterium]|jgi:DNA-binding CsgD family transcriptional regulator|nr:LuxR C-terminal-related transcriptional regulator [Alphaproteobacteria bacterium]
MMTNLDCQWTLEAAQEVDKITKFFLVPRKIAYFQFRRIYKDNTYIVLSNHPHFLNDFLEKGFIEPSVHRPILTRQSFILFWDESFSESLLSCMKDRDRIYHGLSIINRRKNFYDCASFAMPEPHPSPYIYYLHIMMELQRFSEIFPSLARNLIEKAPKEPLKPFVPDYITHEDMFLPKRSIQYPIGEDATNYITTYEALCAQLFLECKSYKEIASILSIAPSTVETHLRRLKERTGLSIHDILLQTFHEPKKKKNKHHRHSPNPQKL